MPYCTSTDVAIALGGAEHLLELADHDADGTPDAAVVAAAIAKADSVINSYLQPRYAVPIASPSDALKACSAEEAAYVLKKNRDSITERDRDDKADRMAWLKDISLGRAAPGVDPREAKSTSVAAKTITRSEDADISRDSLKGFV